MLNPSIMRRQAKRFKETGSVKNRKVNRRRHVLTVETLHEIRTYLSKISKTFITGNWSVGYVSSVQRATKLLKLHIRILNIHTFAQ